MSDEAGSCGDVSTGRGALLLPGKVKRVPRVLGGRLHLPGPVVRMTANPHACNDPCRSHCYTFLHFSRPVCSAADRSGTFSDGFFSYGIEPVYNGSTQVTGRQWSAHIWSATLRTCLTSRVPSQDGAHLIRRMPDIRLSPHCPGTKVTFKL